MLKLKTLKPFIIIAVLAFAFSLVFFSNIFTKAEKNMQTVTLSPTQELDVFANNTAYTIYFDVENIPSKTLTLSFASDAKEQFSLTGQVYIQDIAFKPNYSSAAYFELVPNGKNNSITVPFTSTSGVTSVKLDLHSAADNYVLTSAVLNIEQDIKISFDKFIILFLFCSFIFSIIKYKWYSLIFDFNNKKHILLYVSVLILCLIFSLYIVYLGQSSSNFGKPYSEDMSNSNVYNNYDRHFDAWLNGQTYFTQGPSEELLSLDNPFSFEERREKDVPYILDAALYNDNYYSYFGISILICVYIPFYILTDSLPTILTVAACFTFLAIIAVFGAFQELARYFKFELNLILYLLCAPGIVFGGLLYYAQASFGAIYCLPIIAAVAFLMLFIFFVYKGARLINTAQKYTCFILGALSMALCVASRPTISLFCIIFGAPVFLKILLNKTQPIKCRIIETSSFVMPAFAFCMAVLTYNYVRFGSFAEFGNTYNVTVNDVRFNTLMFSPTFLWDVIYHNFLMPFELSAQFPFVSMGHTSVGNFGRYFYTDFSIGLFAMPLALPLLFINKTFKDKNTYKKMLYISVIACSVIVSYISSCIGGIIERYTIDFIPPMLLISALILLELIQHCPDNIKKTALCIAYILCILTILSGVFVLFTRSEGWGTWGTGLFTNNPDTYINLKNFFSAG